MYNKKTVFWAACFGMLLFGIGLITLGSIAPDLKEKFRLDDLATATLFSILPIGILAGSLVFGPICDRYGYKWLLVFSCVGMCAGFEGIAFASSPGWLRVFIFLFGICAGMINGATNAVVSDISKGAEGANLSLLGVFFGIGALGMPFVTGALKESFSSFEILEAVGGLTLAVGIFYLFTRFPPAKKAVAAKGSTKTLFRENYLYLIAFYLFFQGSIEAILNNWTTTYLTKHLSMEESRALYALSLYVLGLTLMRLMIGSVLRNLALPRLMFASITLVLTGFVLLHFAGNYFAVAVALVICGVGLAAGFPIMLGLAGNRFESRSGTAFSIILTIALVGNMLVNYLMGVISKNYGIHHLTTVAFSELAFMFLLCFLIFRSDVRTKVAVEAVTEKQLPA